MINSVEFPPDRFIQPQRAASAIELVDSLEEAVLEALEAPVDFPPLKEFVFDGDRIALALSGTLPAPEKCAAVVVNAIARLLTGTEIVLVASDRLNVDWEQFEQAAKTTLPGNVTFCCQIHDPVDPNAVAYIAASRPGNPIYINRALFDADVVIPIGSICANDRDDRPILYPEFSSAETIARFRNGSGVEDSLIHETRLARQHLGADMSILIVSGPGETIKKALCGQIDSISEAARLESGNDWQVPRQSGSHVIVATIESGPESQNWDQFFLALQAASRVTENAPQIVICTEIHELPDAFFNNLLQLPFESDNEITQQQLKTLPAHLREIPAILQTSSVFLKSHLGQDDVEELGLGFIESDAQIQRIVDSAEAGIVLRDAHLCRIVQDITAK